MKKYSILILLAILASLGVADAQMRTARFKLNWTDNSDNELGFKAYIRRNTGVHELIGEVGANVTTFIAPAVTFTEGSTFCYAVTAWNNGLAADGTTVIVQESARSNDGCADIPITPVTALPLNLTGDVSSVPEYGATSITVTKPAGATKSFLVLSVFDADFVDEGELFVNGNGPIGLFHSATSAGNGIVTTVEIEIPLDHWVDGANILRFVHTTGGGYRIDSASVRFEIPPPTTPSGLEVTVGIDTTVNVSRRPIDTVSTVSVLINKDELVGPEGVEIAYPVGTTLNISRRADNTTSVVSFLVNKSQAVTVNGQAK